MSLNDVFFRNIDFFAYLCFLCDLLAAKVQTFSVLIERVESREKKDFLKSFIIVTNKQEKKGKKEREIIESNIKLYVPEKRTH